MNNFSHATLYVNDLAAMAHFYIEVFQLKKMNLTSKQAEQQNITEVLLGSDPPGGPTLIIRQYTGDTPLTPGEVMLGFSSDELAAVIQRVEANGGQVVQALKSFTAEGEAGEVYNGQLVIVADAEGHRIEISHIVSG